MVCAPVVTTPRAVAEASGILKVCTLPEEEILKFVPVAPVAKVCVAAVSPFRLEIVVPDTVNACQAPLDRTISCFVGVKKITIPSGGDIELIKAVSAIRASNNPWLVEFNSSNADF